MSRFECPGFCSDMCIHGCPKALHNENPDLYEDIDCKSCHGNTSDCRDCLFENTEACVKLPKTP